MTAESATVKKVLILLFHNLNRALSGEQHPFGMLESEEFWDGVQTILDVAGLVPGAGEVADGINAAIYALRKDYMNAGLSAAAMIPFAGWFSSGGKFINKAAKHGDEVIDAAKRKFAGNAGEGAGKLTRRDELLNSVQNDKLKNAVNEIYRPGATTGDGGLADAVRHELSTGELVGGRSHIKKAMERATNLENIIKKQNLSPSDLDIANKLLNDLKNALGGN